MLVLSIQSVNALLGCVNLAWPSTLSSLDAMTRIKVYGQVLMLVGQGFLRATGVALVEELLFRSWLPQEIAADLGYYQGIIISGLAFSLFQRLFSTHFTYCLLEFVRSFVFCLEIGMDICPIQDICNAILECSVE